MDFPNSLQTIVKEAAAKHVANIDAAVDAALAEWRKLDEREEFIDQLERKAVRAMIHDCRHASFVSMRREQGVYGQPSKVTGTGAANEIAKACLLATYCIAGTPLGRIKGDQIASLAASEAAKAEGSAFNARLLRTLAPLVPADKCIGEVVTENKAAKLFRQCGKAAGGATVAIASGSARRAKQTLPPELAAAGG